MISPFSPVVPSFTPKKCGRAVPFGLARPLFCGHWKNLSGEGAGRARRVAGGAQLSKRGFREGNEGLDFFCFRRFVLAGLIALAEVFGQTHTGLVEEIGERRN